ncbi:transcription-repair coupling factor [Bacteroidetes bacterium endosymbiont of Geopemphigus sp.]|uniref:transcription-repair coupling factor n=1 Tax=Bacteroidetes bacterium endosymbiont of Geopemphigus sp. TaxID=2047937 RepID=UPI000CD26D17|nr:transcription-repair coupling factor [Bacteroidetes bacterium endosymbiont of Geopemphigus sp.]
MPDKNTLLKHYIKSPLVHQLGDFIKKHPEAKLQLLELSGALQALFFAALYQRTSSSLLFLARSQHEASHVFSDLQELFPKERLLFYPASSRRPYEIEEIDNANVLLRAKIFQQLTGAKDAVFIVTSAEALFEKVITAHSLRNLIFTLNRGEKVSIEFINEWLFDQGFQRVDFVNSPGEFSVRGGILDVFSFSATEPFRVEFFGDEIESLRSFEIENQRSLENFHQITLLPPLSAEVSQESYVSFFNLLPKDAFIFLKDGPLAAGSIDAAFEKASQAFGATAQEICRSQPENLFITKTEFIQGLENFTVIESVKTTLFYPQEVFFLKSRVQPTFNKRFELLIKDLKNHAQKGYSNYLCCTNERQIERFKDIFQYLEEQEVPFLPLAGSLHSGFIDETHQLLCYTDHEIFERFHAQPSHKKQSIQKALTLKSLLTLNPGDYVTHIDHGIGRFAGLVKIDLHGKGQETIKIIYQNNDILYVSIHSLHKIAKFTGKGGAEPSLNKLGSPAWKQLKNKTKTKVKELAFDLIQLYAKRKVSHGFAFSPDTYLQNELEASFLYEDTPDQLRATQEVKADMESDRPMDRLICGDVGFGKTEVAMRAAFKVVTDGKQVALLVPTTILAFQHHRSFTDRFKDFPVSIDYLSRFRSSTDKKQILERLKKGNIDLIIGTHQLINKNVHFKDLGLIIIDEEHKFGVAVKDRLKMLRNQVDTLALTATPIPRTLQFSLMAARDLSIIHTPPANRRPIDTRLMRFDPESIRDAIDYELSRGGQVFFIHNRVAELPELYTRLQSWLPHARIAIGHGKMKGKKLEGLMLDFIEGKIDILLSTTIIESGLDVPNVNTIFIYQAQNFGLADLHQMRGRVGRSNIQAFCYLITPPMSYLSDEARKRLQAIEMFSDLGSGFQIAMKDLEIRGAGNLLGGEQSGFISEMGFDTYQKILNEAVQELKHDEFKLLYEQDKNPEVEEVFVSEVQIDTDMELLIPSNYVNSIAERLELYRALSVIEDQTRLNEFREQLRDRFGPLPDAAEELLCSVRLKYLCVLLGFEKISLKRGVMLLYFMNDPQSPYYQSGRFRSILNYVHRYPREISLKERKKKEQTALILRIEKVTTVSQATAWLERLAAFLASPSEEIS